MRPRRSAASLFVLALTTTLMVFIGQAPAQAAEVETRVVYQQHVPRKMQFNRTVSVIGEVQGKTESGDWARVPFNSGPAYLERKFAGTTTWKVVQTDQYGDSFAFYSVKAVRNASYRVRFGGGTVMVTPPGGGSQVPVTFAPTTGAAKVMRVARRLNDEIRSSTLTLRGKVAPRYARKNVIIERKTCQKGCKWQRWATVKTNRKSRWSKKLAAPSSGTWYWRAYTPKSTKFIKSYSDFVYKTYRF